MIVLLDGLQAGNRSGTGAYTAALVREMGEVAGDPDVAVVWPQHLPSPLKDEAPRVALVRREARKPLRRLWFEQWAIESVRKRMGAQLVHFPATVGSVTAPGDTVVTVHDLAFLREPGWFPKSRVLYYRFAVGASTRKARRVIADSQATADDLVGKLGIAPYKIDVIPLGVDARFRPATPEESGTVGNKYNLPERFLLYMGTLEPRKNLVRLVQAWDRMAGEWDGGLVLAGREGWKTAEMHRAIASSPHRKRIHIAGFIVPEDQPALLSACRGFVWPSLWEGFGLPPLEAMACGAPVLTSDRSSMPEVVGDAALLADPEDAGALAEAMLRLSTDDALRARLIEAGLARAAQYTWRKTAELTLTTYRRALGLES